MATNAKKFNEITGQLQEKLIARTATYLEKKMYTLILELENEIKKSQQVKS